MPIIFKYLHTDIDSSAIATGASHDGHMLDITDSQWFATDKGIKTEWDESGIRIPYFLVGQTVVILYPHHLVNKEGYVFNVLSHRAHARSIV